jgi:hypothetical protein
LVNVLGVVGVIVAGILPLQLVSGLPTQTAVFLVQFQVLFLSDPILQADVFHLDSLVVPTDFNESRFRPA